MTERVFLVTAGKMTSFIIDENIIKFSSHKATSLVDFHEAWNKKITLAKKHEVKLDSIRSIKKEENDDDVTIKYKNFAGINSAMVLSFQEPSDCDLFFNYFEKQHFFQRTNETLSPTKAIKNYVIGLVVAIGITIFSYFEAVKIGNSTADVEIHSRKGRFYHNIIGMIGENGVLLIGGLISKFIIYTIWTRYKNPPTQIVLTAPNI